MIFSLEPDLELSIVTVNHNAKKLLRKCLESIFRFQRDLKFEIMVVDNCSEDESAGMLKVEFPQVRLLENRRNLGFAAACNQGISQSRGRYILLLNPDTEFTSGGVTEMIRFIDSHPQIGICGPRMVDPKGRVHFSCRSFPSYLTSISSRQSILNRIFPGNPLSRRYLLKDLNRLQRGKVDWVSGSSLLARREVFERIGLLDERFFMYVEDVDFCYRAKRADILTYYFPDAEIVHHAGASTRRRWIWMRVEHHRSMYHFYRKHHRPNLLLNGMVFLAIWIRLYFTVLTGLLSRRRK